MIRVKVYVKDEADRYCLCVGKSTTVKQLSEILAQRLDERRDSECKHNYQDMKMNVKLQMQDGYTYNIFDEDVVGDIMKENDLFIMNFVKNNKKVKKICMFPCLLASKKR